MTSRIESEFIADRIADFVFVQEKKTLHEMSLNIESLLRTVLPSNDMQDYRDHHFQFDHDDRYARDVERREEWADA